MKQFTRTALFFICFGFLAAAIFPFFAGFFVDWKRDMFPYFVFICFLAGAFVALSNVFILKAQFNKFHQEIIKSLKDIIQIGMPKEIDPYEKSHLTFQTMKEQIIDLKKNIENQSELRIKKVQNDVEKEKDFLISETSRKLRMLRNAKKSKSIDSIEAIESVENHIKELDKLISTKKVKKKNVTLK